MLRGLRELRPRASFGALARAFASLRLRMSNFFVHRTIVKHPSARALLLPLLMLQRALTLVLAVAAAPLTVTAPPWSSAPLRGVVLLSTLICSLKLSASNAEGGGTDGRERIVVGVHQTVHFSFPNLRWAHAAAATDSVQDTATSSPWQVVSAQGASFQGTLDDIDSHSKHRTADPRGAETPTRNNAKPENDGNREDTYDFTEVAMLDGTSTPQTEDDDILSFLQLALGAAVVFAVSTWLLLEQRKALIRARHDRLTDLLGT